MNLENFYEKNYKKLIIISYSILLISIILVLTHVAKTGDPFNRDITLKGGVSATIYKEDLSLQEINDFLKQNVEDFDVRKLTDPNTGKQTGLIVEVADINEGELKNLLAKKIAINYENKEEYDASITSEEFGRSFYQGLMIALIFAFVLMSIVVLIAFKTFIPSIAVISAALTDILATLAILNLIGIKLSAAGVVAFLLVIGYSIDTDILLTTRLLKRREEGSLYERLKHSITTGLTMTVAAIAALTVGYFVAIPEQLKQIFLVIIIALVFDIISTYFGNASILIWYMKKKNIT